MQSLLVMRCLIIAESDLPIHTRVNTEQDEAKHYIGLAETSFKVRFANRETSVYNENTGAALSYRSTFGTLAIPTKKYTVTWSIKGELSPKIKCG